MSATSRQTWAIFCMTKKDHRPYNLTLEKASEIIGKLKAGETVTDCPCGEVHQISVNPKAKELVGKIFYESWGYDQTNIDFIKVVDVSPSGKTVMCQMVSQRVVKTETSMSEYVAPHEAFGEPFRLHVRQRGEEIRLVGQYPFCLRLGESLADAKNRGAMKEGYFFLWENKPMFQSHWH